MSCISKHNSMFILNNLIKKRQQLFTANMEESIVLLLKSTSLISPPKTRRSPLTPFLNSLTSLFFLLLFTAPIPTSSAAQIAPQTLKITSDNALTYYTQHCNQIVPQSPPTATPVNPSLALDRRLHFEVAYFTGGTQLLPQSHDVVSRSSSPISLSFLPSAQTLFLTQDPQVVSFQASLKFLLPRFRNFTWRGRNLRQIRFRPPKIPVRRGSLVFDLYGFWSMSTGKLCMVGSESSFSRNLGVSNSRNVALKLDFPVNVGNISRLISGVLESLNGKDTLGYFEPVSILGIPNSVEYRYSLINEGKGNQCALSGDDESDNESDSLHLKVTEPDSCLTELYDYARIFELEQGSECRKDGGSKCDPLGGGVFPKFMRIQGLRCDYGRAAQVLIEFQHSDFPVPTMLSGYEISFDPNTSLIGEGTWDEKNNKLCVVGCRTLNFRDSLVNASVGDCSVLLSLRFRRTLTIEHRSPIEGQIFSNRPVNDSGNFGVIRFDGYQNRRRLPPGLRYTYTVLDKVSKYCAVTKTLKGKRERYPSGHSNDMRIFPSVKNDKGQTARGYLIPLFVGDKPFDPYKTSYNYSNSGLINISYQMRFLTSSEFKFGDQLLSNTSLQISAEGTYDDGTGVLCMVGCRQVENGLEDCKILIHAQFSPLNAKGGAKVKGTIESMRGKSEPLYFEPLVIDAKSIYFSQAAESIWRMDMEIAMVLISSTLTCVFVGLQFYHVKRHPDVLPFISFVMLLVLTLGHMVPLVLNFEALFMANHNKQDVFLEGGGWLEVNEVAVRVVTMVALLLELRLLQLSWSARQSERNRKSFWLSEKKVLYLSVPWYIGGALISWYVGEWNNSSGSQYFRSHGFKQQHYVLRGLKSYTGLIQDGFLLPQIVFNFFLNARENSLAAAFYIGTAVVRILPHAYDLYRAHNFSWYLDFSYIYANPWHDYYSTAWDIIVPLGCLIFAALIYLQQRYGGRIVVTKTPAYEKVPVSSSGGGETQGMVLQITECIH